jgi:predicted RNA polymerase sigma factor
MNAAVTVNERSFEEWYRSEYRRLLATVTLATRNVEVGRDATDEAFARAYERWSRVCTMAEPNGWLYRVALNVARRIVRRRAMEARALRRTVLWLSTDLEPSTSTLASVTVWTGMPWSPASASSVTALSRTLVACVGPGVR